MWSNICKKTKQISRGVNKQQKMAAKKPKIVIIGAGMAGLTAANKLYNSSISNNLFELCVVEGGSRIGGRINTSKFGGDRIEMGATWIHGIGGSPVHKIAEEIHALESETPWECMDGFSEQLVTIGEGGFKLNPSVVESVSTLFKNLMDYAQGKLVIEDSERNSDKVENFKLATIASKNLPNNGEYDYDNLSIGSFLRQGLDAYWASKKNQEEVNGFGDWSIKSLEEAIFAIHENNQRTYTSAGDLLTLDYSAEKEYCMFPSEEITIAKGYLSIIESLASGLPSGLIQLDKRVTQIEWLQETHSHKQGVENSYGTFLPVKLHFSDGSIMFADHVIVTVSLGVLKAGIEQSVGLFNPPLPRFKTQAISRLGFGVVNKLFLQLNSTHDSKSYDLNKFPFLQMAFHRNETEFKQKKIPWWMRRTTSMFPIYQNSNVLLSWFAGEEALELESLEDEVIIKGVSATISSFLFKPNKKGSSISSYNGIVSSEEHNEVKISKILKSKWGRDPLFLGSYSYVAVGSSGDDLDTMAEPLPRVGSFESTGLPPLQILFAGEATHRTHYSTTHGAYFSGLREANRLLQHYHCVEV